MKKHAKHQEEAAPREELGEDGSQIGVEYEDDLSAAEPFDPASISVEPKVVALDAVIRRLKSNTIRLSPGFQRKLVWDEKRRSQLIKSLMLRIPLPMFYVAADEKGSWDVVDGLQRLTAIKDYILGPEQDGRGFALSDLEFWGDKFNGRTFRDIQTDSTSDQSKALILNNIMETELRFTVVNPGTPEVVKRNIFKRINTGGMPLTPQEIRHALYQGESTDLLKRLTARHSFKDAINGALDDSRMAAQELVLRFLSFSIFSFEGFPSDMDKFLSSAMLVMNRLSDLDQAGLAKLFRPSPPPKVRAHNLDELTKRFDLGMNRSRNIFGDHAFQSRSLVVRVGVP